MSEEEWLAWLEQAMPEGPAMDPADDSLLAKWVRGEWEPS